MELDDQEAARTEDGKKGEAAAPAAEAVVINVALEQVEPLAEMLAGEAPANVALLVTHLSGDIRTRLLAALPAPMSEEVLASLGKVRYVEPEVIESLKEEVERRLAGAVGGIGRLISLIEAGDFADRQRMIETLAARDPELGRRLRERVFLLENLAELDKTEWSLLKAKVSNEDWAWALSQGPQEVVEALRQNSAPGSWQILSQMLSDPGVTSDQRRGAQQRLAQAVTALIVDGKINGLAARSVKRLESATMRS
ncbi:MAG: hypothetical protein HYZ74_01860 [Elusimicrobia bacterium]|nr:hypothetical protein [Elusimicrobiota bacterium]